MDTHQLVVIFCEVDDFCKELDTYTQHRLLTGHMPGRRGPDYQLAISEMMTILLMFQMAKSRDLKRFYQGFLQHYWQTRFPALPSYPRFISLMKRAFFPMALL